MKSSGISDRQSTSCEKMVCIENYTLPSGIIIITIIYIIKQYYNYTGLY